MMNEEFFCKLSAKIWKYYIMEPTEALKMYKRSSMVGKIIIGMMILKRKQALYQ